MNVQLLLADAATTSDGKVHALGLGWTHVPTPLPPFMLIAFVDVDHTATTVPVQLDLELVDADGHLVHLPSPNGPVPVNAQMTGTVQGDPNAGPGALTRLPLVLSYAAGMPLPPGRYQWRAIASGDFDHTATQTFTVVPAPTRP